MPIYLEHTVMHVRAANFRSTQALFMKNAWKCIQCAKTTGHWP